MKNKLYKFGCTLYKTPGIKKHDYMYGKPENRRCTMFLDCSHAMKCLNAVAKLDWKSFSSDCKGFSKRNETATGGSLKEITSTVTQGDLLCLVEKV